MYLQLKHIITYAMPCEINITRTIALFLNYVRGKQMTQLALDTTNIYGNSDEDSIFEARSCYAKAILLANEPEVSELDTVIRLLDRALQLVPDFLDAYYFRQEIWHEILIRSKNTPEKTSEYHRYLSSDAWQEKKAQVLKRDGHRCACCNTETTEVHHKTYDNIGKEPFNDLTTMCRPCHEKYHNSQPFYPQLGPLPSGQPEPDALIDPPTPIRKCPNEPDILFDDDQDAKPQKNNTVAPQQQQDDNIQRTEQGTAIPTAVPGTETPFFG